MQYYVAYSVMFAILTIFVFWWFIFQGRTFVWKEDGFRYHINSLVYVAKYLRRLFRSFLLTHKIVIPQWDFNIGEGTDVLMAQHYFMLGNLLALPAVFVPSRYMYIYFNIMVLAHIYIAGICFSNLCFYTGKSNRIAVLAGSITYSFSYWALYNVCRHVCFLIPLVWFPLLIIGVEKIIRCDRPYTFIISVACAAISNFYYFYVMALLSILYVGIRLVYKYRCDVFLIIKMLLKLLLPAVFGVGIAAIIFLPVLYIFISDFRKGKAENLILYPLAYYLKLPSLLFSSTDSYWFCASSSAPAILGVYCLLCRKGNGLFKVMLIACAIIASFPFLGALFNGFAYRTNKWSWVFSLLCAYILVVEWQEMQSLTVKQLFGFFSFFFIYMSILLFSDKYIYAQSVVKRISLAMIIQLYILGCFILAIKLQQIQPLIRISLCLLLIGASIFFNAYFKFSPNQEAYSSAFMTSKELDKLLNNETVDIKKALANDLQDCEDYSFFRWSGRGMTARASPSVSI